MSREEIIKEYRRIEKLIDKFNLLTEAIPNLAKLTFKTQGKELRFFCEKEKRLSKNILKKLNEKDE